MRFDRHVHYEPVLRQRAQDSFAGFSSNFPNYERNLNTGGNNYDETSWVVAENTIYHSPENRLTCYYR